jgi:hypothetical protein
MVSFLGETQTRIKYDASDIDAGRRKNVNPARQLHSDIGDHIVVLSVVAHDVARCTPVHSDVWDMAISDKTDHG